MGRRRKNIDEKEIAQWVRGWIKEHPDCKDLTNMYEDFNYQMKLDTYTGTGKLTTILLGINPIKYVRYIPRGMFSECSSITNITVPGQISWIGDSAFYNCTNLKIATIINGVTDIGNFAFYGCSNLISIEIPNSVTHIGDRVFFNCVNLNSIQYNGTKDQWNKIKKYDGWDSHTGRYVIYCSDGKIVGHS